MIKTEELRNLEHDELAQRLKDSRRELFELRFKHAVGQLENHRQILQVRKDIARILTVIHEHRLGNVPHSAPAEEAPAQGARVGGGEAVVKEETPEDVEEVAAEAEAPPAPQKKTSRKKAAESQEETE